MKAEDDCKVERKHTLKLRHAMEQRPSQDLLWELQQEKELLQARVQELQASVQLGAAGPGASLSPAAVLPPCAPRHPQEGTRDKSSPYIQVLEEDWRQALQEHQEQANVIFALRKDLRQGEALRIRVCCWDSRTRAWGLSQAGWAHSACNGAFALSSTSLRPPSWRHRGQLLTPPFARCARDGQGQPLVWKPRVGRA